MKIKFKFLGVGYNKFNQAEVFIYDQNNRLVRSGQTYNGIICFELEKNKVYKLIAKSNFEEIKTYFYTNKCFYTFIFNNIIIEENNLPITFILTDYYYNNLMIEKGELLVWQK